MSRHDMTHSLRSTIFRGAKMVVSENSGSPLFDYFVLHYVLINRGEKMMKIVVNDFRIVETIFKIEVI